MDNHELEDYLIFAKQLASEAGEIMRQYFRSDDIEQREKDDKTIVTIADEKINNIVIERIAKSYPRHAVFGEEASLIQESEYTWVCDPIDGTFLFAKGIPMAVFSLALVKNGEPLVGVVYDPFLDIFYTAIKGQGAFMNDKQIHVSTKLLDYRAALNLEDWPSAELQFHQMKMLAQKEKSLDFYRIGSIVHVSCLVAQGAFEAAIFAGTAKKCDIAAVKVIVEEAGGKVTDVNGHQQRYDGDINGAIVSNGIVHEQLVDLIKRSSG